ncbi:MAG: MaoC/PaaZ C-terminal domain-containing protein [Halioglobus sp.]
MEYFEDIKIGGKVEYPEAHELTKEEIISVAQQWDPQPFHVDEEAAKESFFGGLVAASTHLFGIATKVTHSATEVRAAISALGFNEVKVAAPARPGDILRGRAECLSKRESKSKPGVGIVEDKLELYNQRGEVVYTHICAALYKKRSESNT